MAGETYRYRSKVELWGKPWPKAEANNSFIELLADEYGYFDDAVVIVMVDGQPWEYQDTRAEVPRRPGLDRLREVAVFIQQQIDKLEKEK
jgi:hypothetical protein